jgi:cysteinyl-tRNA synthetase
MSIRIYNSFTRKKEEFQPIEDEHVRMYVCGITAYDRCHIGHARSAVVFDAVVRHLRSRGYRVTFVRNFTDIDDKIINRANQEGISCAELSEREISHFYQDMDALGILRADIEPKATEHIDEIIGLIERLIAKGAAYEAGGDVYFSVKSFPTYGALSGRNIEEMLAGARIAPGELKREPGDFALWKTAKPGEPTWDSPWGPGRPGWHIECSAMSMKYLGETLDIHGGGLDLIFPHHENERAQSEAATGKEFVRVWMHNGFVTIKGDKMSKSLNNFITIQDILKQYHPEALRLFLLSKHYRSPLDYSPEAIGENLAALDRCYNAVAEAERLADMPVKKRRPITEKATEAIDELNGFPEKFNLAMDDDFNTARATGALFEAVRALNRLNDQAASRPSALYAEPLLQGVSAIRDAAGVLGILQQEPKEYLRQRNLDALEEAGLDEKQLLDLIERRNAARREKDWAEADRIRDELLEKNIVLQDGPEGTAWTARRG